MTRSDSGRNGLILLIVLWVMVVLSILGTSYYHLSTIEFLTNRNDLEKLQAELLAESALYLAYTDLNLESSKGSFDLSGDWAGGGKLFEQATLGKGLFQIYTDDVYSEEGGTRFGLRDECSKLNLNTATREMLEKLPRMTSARAAALIDWRDTDSQVTRGGGAEEDYYSDLSPAYSPRNGPLLSVGELLQVKGFNPRVVLGEDANRDGILQPAENDGDKNDPPDNQDGKLDRGLLPYITVYSSDRNVNAAGEKRININTADENTLKQRLMSHISEEKIRKIIDQRSKTKFESAVDLLAGAEKSQKASSTDSEKSSSEDSSSEGKSSSGSQSDSDKQSDGEDESTDEGDKSSDKGAGRKKTGGGGKNKKKQPAADAILTEEEFIKICDEITTVDDENLPGMININTAPREVLMCLPGMNRRIADEILEHRGGDLQSFSSAGELLSLDAMNLDRFSRMYPLLTVRSSIFEARAVGYLSESNAYASILAVIDRSGTSPKFLYYRVMR
ncbi:MAG: general secretion pathway protein GspK [Candidatus Omnitrophica bacterium]|jgi:type II secretory pathway component PulK|nr:general secretion pathway protein GspK [bacterium]MBK7495364.1 general secretion pathway protein GspK [Candidatus Omnitrophota bacterium]MBV6481864.1 hypothetical protein [bacterium]MCC6733426.1 general secretion pathway protein GspK [Candidatus Omnitrophota bacterium]